MFAVGDIVVVTHEELVGVEGTIISLYSNEARDYPVEIRLHEKGDLLLRLTSDFKMWKGDATSCIQPLTQVIFEM